MIMITKYKMAKQMCTILRILVFCSSVCLVSLSKFKISKQNVVVSDVKTCEVISKKFNGDYSEKSGVYTIIFGWMKITIEYDSMGRYLNMWVINSSYESNAKREVEALKDAEGDGSDAL